MRILKELQDRKKKSVLKLIYGHFYRLIAENLTQMPDAIVVEIGSGIGNIKEFIPNCILTDLFPNPRIDHVENAYQLSFPDRFISDLILIDVFHHIQYPGSALKEFHRVLRSHGRVIIFDPCLSLLGFIVYGLFHQEPLNWRKAIEWFAPDYVKLEGKSYYAAQANASKIFLSKAYEECLSQWKVITKRRFSAISYVTSGGYSKPQLYPSSFLPLMQLLDRIGERFPPLFATRLLVVLEKKEDID